MWPRTARRSWSWSCSTGRRSGSVVRRGDRRLPVRFALGVAYQLLDVLAAAHAKNIVHRDIKPANLFLTRLGDLKVLDFGIARLRDSTSALHAITQSGTMLGTPAFMAPEQARGQTKEVEGRTDLMGGRSESLRSGERAARAPRGFGTAAAPHRGHDASSFVEERGVRGPRGDRSSRGQVARVRQARAMAGRSHDARRAARSLRRDLRRAPDARRTRRVLCGDGAAPVRSTSRPPAGKEAAEPPPAVMESAVGTKVEGKGAPKLAKTLPLEQTTRAPARDPQPERKMPEKDAAARAEVAAVAGHREGKGVRDTGAGREASRARRTEGAGPGCAAVDLADRHRRARCRGPACRTRFLEPAQRPDGSGGSAASRAERPAGSVVEGFGRCPADKKLTGRR